MKRLVLNRLFLRGGRWRRRRSVEEAVGVLWMVVDEAKSSMNDPLMTSEERRHWAKILTDTVGVLNKLLANMGEKQFEYSQPKTAREHVYMKFWHPLRRHDDQLFALALACYASKEEEPFITVLPMT